MKSMSIASWAMYILLLLFVSCGDSGERSSNHDSQTVTMTRSMLDSLSPAEILQKFKEGNKRFVEGKMLRRDYRMQVAMTSSGQHPYAIVLSCIDSRNPAEFIFDEGIGDIFNARVAGNFVNSDILGSLEYACKVSGAKVILVMGHTECGAVKSACDRVELGNITALLSNLKPAIDSVKGFDSSRSSKNKDFVQAVAKENVILTERKILENSPIISKMVDSNQVRIVGCMYNIKNGMVEFYQ